MYNKDEYRPSLMANEDDILIAKSWINKYEWYKDIFEKQKEYLTKFIKKKPIFVSPVKQTYQYKMYNCPKHDVELLYEEDYPFEHHCPIDKNEVFTGYKYDSAWSGWYNRKLATNLVWLGLLYNIYGNEEFAEAGKEIILQFANLYLQYPVENTILGPAHVFFGTLSESFWGVDMAYGYDLLYNYKGFTNEERDLIKNKLFYPLAEITQQFPESASNRQLWYNNVSAAVGFIYKDEKLIDFALNGKYGFKWQLGSALPESGFWGEGPGYHFVTLRAMIHLAEMCIRNGIDLYRMQVNGRTMKLLFDSPLSIIKPNYEFPRIKDSGGGNLLDYSTFYEVGYSVYGDKKYLAVIKKSNIKRGTQIVGEESGKGERETPITLFQLIPELPECEDEIYTNESINLKGNGLAILRSGQQNKRKYLYLDYGIVGGEHGHPDRLQIGYYANNKNWIVDPLNESYFNPNLQTWFRQTIAHNTIVIDETTQAWANGNEKFYASDSLFQVISGYSKEIYPGSNIERTLTQVDEYFIDIVEVKNNFKRIIDYPIHSFGILNVEGCELEKAPLDTFGPIPGIPGYDQLTDIYKGISSKPVNFIFSDDSYMKVFSLINEETEIFKCINPPIGGFYKQMIKEQKPQPMFMLRRNSNHTKFINLFHVYEDKPEITDISSNEDITFTITANSFIDTLLIDSKNSQFSIIRYDNNDSFRFAVGFNTNRIEKKHAMSITSECDVKKIKIQKIENILYIEVENGYRTLKIKGLKGDKIFLNGELIYHKIIDDIIIIEEKNKIEFKIKDKDNKLFRGFKNTINFDLFNYSSEDKSIIVTFKLAENWYEKVKNQIEWWGGVVNLLPENKKCYYEQISPSENLNALQSFEIKKEYIVKKNSKLDCYINFLIPSNVPLAKYPFEFSFNENKINLEYSILNPIDVNIFLPNLRRNQLKLIISNNTNNKILSSISLDGKLYWKIKDKNLKKVLSPNKTYNHTVKAELKGYNSEQKYPVKVKIKSEKYEVQLIKTFVVAYAYQVEKELSLNGDWKGWIKTTPIKINRSDQVCKLLMGNQKWNGPEDLSAEIYVMYDRKYLYIGADVKDDIVISNWNYPEMSYPWDTDSIEFMIDIRTNSDQGCDPPTPGFYRHLMLAEYRKTDFAQWRFGSAGGPILPKPNLLKNAETYFKKKNDGYIMICKIPLVDFGKQICRKGNKIGFDIGINDNDGTSFRKNLHIWSSYTQNQVWWVIESIGALIFK